MIRELFGRVRVFIVYKAKPVLTAHIVHHFLGGGVDLLILQVIDLRLPVYICLKTVQGKAAGCKGIFPISVKVDIETDVCTFFMLLENLKQFVSHMVQGKVLLPGAVICAVVLQGYRIGKLIIGQKLSVPVPDISSCAFNGPFSGNTQIKIIRIFLTMYDLKRK